MGQISGRNRGWEFIWTRRRVWPLATGLGRSAQGFSLTEVLASVVIISIFAMMTMDILVIAAIFSARAEQYDKAFTWIQEDLELVRFKASEYEKNAFPSSLCNATLPANGLAAGLLNVLGGSPLVLGPRIMGGKPVILTRKADYVTAADPFKLLKIDYVVTPQAGGTQIASLSTEVLPNAALKCP
jgi:prepilin-type N-terminal cleavage/methylation domain-containing protein